MTPRENRMRVAVLRSKDSAHTQSLGSPPSAATLASIRRARQPKTRTGRKAEPNRNGTKSLRAERVA